MGERQIVEQPQNEDNALFSTLGQVIQLMMNRQDQARTPVLPTPNPAMMNRPPIVHNDTAQAPPQQNRLDLPGLIASMSPEQIGDIIVSAASRMDPKARENAFQVVATRLGGLDDLEYDDDDLSTDDDLEDDDLSRAETGEGDN